jgi:DNA-binding transcriptional LysR family regulator
MDTLTSLRVFAAIAEFRSFSLASERLGLSPAMASKHIQHLERRVGSRLLNRTSRSVSLTEAGTLYRDRVRNILEGLDEVETRIGQATVNPRGVLKVSLPIWIVNSVFVQLIDRYRQQFPDVTLDIDLSGRMVSLVEEGFDLAVRSTSHPDEGLIIRKLPPITFVLAASPDFLKRNGRPTGLDDLEGKPFLAYSHVASHGDVRIGKDAESRVVHFQPVVKSSNETLLLYAARQGMGYTIIPTWIAVEEFKSGRLERILPEEFNFDVPFCAVYPNRGYLPAKTRSFLDFIARELERLNPQK